MNNSKEEIYFDLGKKLNSLTRKLKKQKKINNLRMTLGGLFSAGLFIALAINVPHITNQSIITLLAILTPAGLASPLWIADVISKSKSSKIMYEINIASNQLYNLNEKMQKEKELELVEQIETFDYEKQYEEKSDYLDYLKNLKELAEVNPGKAIEMVKKTFEREEPVKDSIIESNIKPRLESSYLDDSKVLPKVKIKKN